MEIIKIVDTAEELKVGGVYSHKGGCHVAVAFISPDKLVLMHTGEDEEKWLSGNKYSNVHTDLVNCQDNGDFLENALDYGLRIYRCEYLIDCQELVAFIRDFVDNVIIKETLI